MAIITAESLTTSVHGDDGGGDDGDDGVGDDGDDGGGVCLRQGPFTRSIHRGSDDGAGQARQYRTGIRHTQTHSCSTAGIIIMINIMFRIIMIITMILPVILMI